MAPIGDWWDSWPDILEKLINKLYRRRSQDQCVLHGYAVMGGLRSKAVVVKD